MEVFIVKVGSGTTPAKAANAIMTYVLKGYKVYVDTIGVAATYAASKAFVLAQKALQQNGISIAYLPSYKDVEINNKDFKTAISWEVIVLKL